jgi:hypothetical protein
MFQPFKGHLHATLFSKNINYVHNYITQYQKIQISISQLWIHKNKMLKCINKSKTICINFPKISSSAVAITCVVRKQDGICKQVYINIKVLKVYEDIRANGQFPLNIYSCC